MAKITTTLMVEFIKNTNRDYKMFPDDTLRNYIIKKFKCSKYIANQVIKELKNKDDGEIPSMVK